MGVEAWECAPSKFLGLGSNSLAVNAWEGALWSEHLGMSPTDSEVKA